jgi:YggT family protein
MLRPVRRILPLIGNFDLSPLVVLLVLQVMLSLVLQLVGSLIAALI